MPELPEVTIMVNELKDKVLKRTIVDVWTDAPKLVKKPISFAKFKNEIIGQKIIGIRRKGKVIIMEFDKGKILLVHPKMTGHFLVGKWESREEEWRPVQKGPLEDPMNRFIHLIFWLDNGQMLAFSDLRKFGRIELWDSSQTDKAEIINQLGQDALEMTFGQFKEVVKKGKQKKIKQLLMSQSLIAGIGNIYSDEVLFQAKVNPFRPANSLSKEEIRRIYGAVKIILSKAIRLYGSSISDFRRISGRKGKFDQILKVYGRQGQKCPQCGGFVQRAKIGGRSAHFCPKCQK